MSRSRVTEEEARQEAQRSAVKSKVERDVNAKIADQAVDDDPGGRDRIAQVAEQMREGAVTDVARGEREVGRARAAARASQFIDYVFYVMYTLLATRLVLALIGARPGNEFVEFIDWVTGPFYAPFRGIVASPTAPGGYTLAIPLLIAMAAYMILHAGINGLFRLAAQRKTDV
ncbi:MAG TPA: YggT family protein [Gemmatimonadaceae bacterium]|nr:YggT family protein [Gemmatimonadaceae bacterium]